MIVRPEGLRLRRVVVAPSPVRRHRLMMGGETLVPELHAMGFDRIASAAFYASASIQALAFRPVILAPDAASLETSLRGAPAWPIEFLRLDLLLRGEGDAAAILDDLSRRVPDMRTELRLLAAARGLSFRETATTGLETAFPVFAWPTLEADSRRLGQALN